MTNRKEMKTENKKETFNETEHGGKRQEDMIIMRRMTNEDGEEYIYKDIEKIIRKVRRQTRTTRQRMRQTRRTRQNTYKTYTCAHTLMQPNRRNTLNNIYVCLKLK